MRVFPNAPALDTSNSTSIQIKTGMGYTKILNKEIRENSHALIRVGCNTVRPLRRACPEPEPHGWTRRRAAHAQQLLCVIGGQEGAESSSLALSQPVPDRSIMKT
jgi:hypothetical protein